MKKILTLLFLIPIVCFSQQIEVPLEKPCPFGYLEFIPQCETITENCQTTISCPRKLLVSLNGFGERGNGTTELYKVAGAGVAKLIRDGIWKRTDFVVVSPQLSVTSNMYSGKSLDVFIKQMKQKYSFIDTTEVYIVGLSGGANSIYPYISNYKGIRGAVAISGYGSSKQAPLAYANGTKIWEFHGDQDQTVPYSTSFYKAYLACEVIKTDNARFTGWPGVGHTGWNEVFSDQWLDKTSLIDPFNEDVFDWLVK